MSLLEAALYGVIQGLTEYLPISSSAHLVLLPRFLGAQDPGLAFDVFVHLGTLCATLFYFRSDWLEMFFRPAQRGRLRQIIWATVPALIAGGLLHKWIETRLRGNLVIVCTLAAFGVLLWWVDRHRSSTGSKSAIGRALQKMSTRDAVMIGCAQTLALIPGVSRSGITMTAGRGLGFSREAAARFSFLLSAPVTGAALVFELRNISELFTSQLNWQVLTVAGLTSFFSGWLAISALLTIVKRFGYAVFAVYRVALATAIVLMLGV